MQTTVATPVVKTTEPMTTRQILHIHHVGTALIFCMSATHTITLFLSTAWLICAGILAKKGGAL